LFAKASSIEALKEDVFCDNNKTNKIMFKVP